jgi:hypothetical protein
MNGETVIMRKGERITCVNGHPQALARADIIIVGDSLPDWTRDIEWFIPPFDHHGKAPHCQCGEIWWVIYTETRPTKFPPLEIGKRWKLVHVENEWRPEIPPTLQGKTIDAALVSGAI